MKRVVDQLSNRPRIALDDRALESISKVHEFDFAQLIRDLNDKGSSVSHECSYRFN
jgi:hypothetical protein